MIPSQATLSHTHGVTVATVRRAISVLRGEGLVETILGQGVAVRKPPAVRRMSSSRYAAVLAKLRSGETPEESAFTQDEDVPWEEHEVICRFRETRADDAVAELLRVEVGAPVFRRHMIMLARGTAMRIRTAYYPLDLVAETPMVEPRRQPWPGGVIAELAALGVTVTATDEDVVGRMPTPEETEILGAPDGVPVFEITRVGFGRRDGDDADAFEHRPVEVVLPIVVRADRYVLHYRTDL